MRRLRIYTRSCRQPVRAEAARWDGSAAFELFATFGFPLEMMRITADYAVHRMELSPEEARESGAIACSESATATASRCTPSATSIPRRARSWSHRPSARRAAVAPTSSTRVNLALSNRQGAVRQWWCATSTSHTRVGERRLGAAIPRRLTTDLVRRVRWCVLRPSRRFGQPVAWMSSRW